MSAVSRDAVYGPFPESMPEPPTACTNCGRALVYVEEKGGFRASDGEALIDPTWRCPVTVGWWNRVSLRFMTHDEYAPDHFGKWYWRRREYR